MKKAVLAIALIVALISPTQAHAATAKAGAACTKLKATQVVGTKKFTCIKSGKKLIWDKGVATSKTVVKKTQTIEFPPIENVYLANKVLILTKAVSSGGLLVSYSASGACTFNAAANTLLLNKPGACTVITSQSGDNNYQAAEAITRSFEILKSIQQITPVSIARQDLLKFSSYSVEIASFGSSAPLNLTSRTPKVCNAVGTNIAYLTVGTCQITFSKAGDSEYEDAKSVDVSFEIFLSALPGDKANPAGLGAEIVKADVSVTVDAINEEVGDDVCLADSANKGCVDKNGIGVFQSADNDRYVEIVFTIVNNSTKTWIASNIGMQVGAEQNYLKTTVYTIDSLDGLELEPGDGITGSYFVLLPNNVDSAKTLISYGDSNEATTFYFKAK
jgi:hypothetical protein